MILTGVALAGLAACSTPTASPPYVGQCAPLQVLEWTPVNDALDVPLDTTIKVKLDDYPDPDTVGLASFIITTGLYYHPGTFGVDLIDKTLTFQAADNLRPDLGYSATVRPALRSLSGCAIVQEQRTFHTSAVGAPPPPPRPPAVPYSAIEPIFARSCAGATCHRAAPTDGATTDAGCLAVPAGGLSLCERDAVAALVGVPSRQVSRLELVARGDSARSYLLRKLLPGSTPDRPAPTTLGHRDPPGAPLADDELRAIAVWIDTGASP